MVNRQAAVAIGSLVQKGSGWDVVSPKRPTTGMLAVLIALSACDQVSVFGFTNFSRRSCDYYWSKPPCKTDFEYTRRWLAGVHNFSREREVLRQWHARGWVRLRY